MILLITDSYCIFSENSDSVKILLAGLKTILNNQESCIIIGGKTTKYFKLERDARQGDPISAYLFVLVLEIFFILVKNNPKVKGLNIFNMNFYIPLMQIILLSFSKIKIL